MPEKIIFSLHVSCWNVVHYIWNWAFPVAVSILVHMAQQDLKFFSWIKLYNVQTQAFLKQMYSCTHFSLILWYMQVILVGHDFGGACISYAMELFPTNVSKAVFVAAIMLKDGQNALDMFSEKVCFLYGCCFTINVWHANIILKFGLLLCKQSLTWLGYTACPGERIVMKSYESVTTQAWNGPYNS